MNNKIGLKIKRIRESHHLTQQEFAKSLGYKDKSMIAHIEKGDSDMTYEKILLLIDKYDVDANELFDGGSLTKNIPSKIGSFKRYYSKESTMKYGSYYFKEFNLPFSNENKRTIRVWLPEDYEFDNPNKRFPVIYMSDGQNLVDRYLSAYGEWELDKTAHKLLKEGISSFIAVGIDCPKTPIERTKELCPPYEPRNEVFKQEGKRFTPCVDKYIDFIVNELKPVIDSSFYTISDKEATAIGGSSMGGIMAFYAYMYRPDIFGFSLSFSPAFFFYKKERWEEIMDEYDLSPDKNGRLFLYVGGKDFEKVFNKPTYSTYEYLSKRGFDNEQVTLLMDTKEIHHEGAWAKYLGEGLKYWLK